MKKNCTISIILFLTAINSFAQPVINIANFPTSYSALAAVAYLPEGSSENLVGNAGADQLWDFSSLQIPLCCHGRMIGLVPLASTLYAPYFPSANYCYRIDTDGEPTSYEYYKLTPTSFELLGGGADFGPNVFEPPFIVMQFPYEFNTQISSLYGSSPTSSTYDAYGTIIYQTETYNNVIRKKTVITDDPVTYYVWYNTNPWYILAEADVSPETTLYKLYGTTVSGSMGVDQNIKEAALTVSPNPANAILNLKLSNNTSVDKVIITDLSGKVVAEKTTNLTSIDVQNLAKGVHILSAYSGTNQLQTKFIKE